MSAEEALGSLARVYAELKEAKEKLSSSRRIVKEETERHPAFANANDELVEVRNKMKLIREESIDNAQMRGDIEDGKREVKELQAVIDDIVANAIAEGYIKNNQEVTLGEFTVTPKVKVTMNLKQMSLAL